MSSTDPQRLRVAAVVLAAGGARRFGRPKQLLEWEGTPLVRRAAQAALASGADCVIVVLGAHRDAVGAVLEGLDVEICANPDWAKGIGSSVAAGVRRALDREVPCRAVLLCLADQPHADSKLLARVVEAGRSGSRRVACGYRGTRGAPAFFSDPTDLALLSSLEGDRGARTLITHEDVHTIPCEAAAEDIDTAADWDRLLCGGDADTRSDA